MRDFGVTALLTVENLTIGFDNAAPVVEGVSFSVEPGKTLALVGESGSGKTLSCRAALRILPAAAKVRSGDILLGSKDGGAPIDLDDPERTADVQHSPVTGGPMIFQRTECGPLSPIATRNGTIKWPKVLALGKKKYKPWPKRDETQDFWGMVPSRVGVPKNPRRQILRAAPFRVWSPSRGV